jgi:hypothetical protein
MLRNGIACTRIKCSVPNVCVVDLNLEQPIRIIALYAPASKTCDWPELSAFVSMRCMLIGDFNIDLEKDGEKANKMMEWMDSCSLGPILPDTNTSLRADRLMDYALVIGVDLSIQAYEGPTTSDHKPLLGVLAVDDTRNVEGFKTIWSVFSLVLSYTSSFWEKHWSDGSVDMVYDEFSSFLALLESRYTQYFPLNHACPSVPPDIMPLLAKSRSLSFKAKRKGDVILREQARRLQNHARYKLKSFQ